MGPLKGILSKIPGVGKQLEGVDIDDRQIDWVQAIILSMTPEERSHPHIMNPSRKRRIAAGSGRSIEEVNRLIKQIDQMQKMMRQMTKGGKGSKKRRKMKGLPGLGGYADERHGTCRRNGRSRRNASVQIININQTLNKVFHPITVGEYKLTIFMR